MKRRRGQSQNCLLHLCIGVNNERLRRDNANAFYTPPMSLPTLPQDAIAWYGVARLRQRSMAHRESKTNHQSTSLEPEDRRLLQSGGPDLFQGLVYPASLNTAILALQGADSD